MGAWGEWGGGAKGERMGEREKEREERGKKGWDGSVLDGWMRHTHKTNLHLARQDFVHGVDLLDGVDAAGAGFDVDDGVLEGGRLGEAGWKKKRGNGLG